jgi:hypothetical protein
VSSEDIKSQFRQKADNSSSSRQDNRKNGKYPSSSSTRSEDGICHSDDPQDDLIHEKNSRTENHSNNSNINTHDNHDDSNNVDHLSTGHVMIVNDEENHSIQEEVFPNKGMARLSRAVAKASADREALKISNGRSRNHNNNDRSYTVNGSSSMNYGNDMVKTHAQTQMQMYRQNNYHQHDFNERLTHGKAVTTEPKSLSQLTRVIDCQLYANGPRGTMRGDYPKINGVVQNARDHMISLLGFNQVQGDWKIHSSTSTFNVAVVFGKELVRDQVTVEYASRIRTLARLFKEEPEFRPNLVCFCGGVAEGSHVANSDAGYIFFRHMCEAQGIDLEGVSIYIDNSSKSDGEAVKHVTDELKKKYIPKWLEDSPETTDLMQKTIGVHFTLVSTEYHLCNMNDVHHRSPEQSLLKEMENMGRDFLDHPRSSFDRSSSIRGNAISGLIKTSWSFQYATYPYIYAKNDLVAFLGKCYLLAEELVPLLVNMKAVVDQKEFFQRDNYLILASIRRSLVEEIETLHKPSHSRKKTLNNELRRLKDMYGKERDVISILEGALLSLGRCVDIVKPAGLHTGSVSREDWRKALKALEHSMKDIRTYCDPDRPLLPSEWGKLVDDDSIPTKKSF